MDFGLQELLIITVGVILAFYYWSTSTYNYWKQLGVRGPKPTPLVGNMGPVFFGRMSINELLMKLYKKWKSESFIGIYNARFPVLMITDPNLVRHVLIKDFHVFPGRGTKVNDNDPLGQHLISLEGYKWKVMRAKLTPIFTTGKLKYMVDLMIECANHFEKYLENKIRSGKVLECREIAAKFTTDVIGSTAFGINMNALENEDSPFRIVGRKIFEPSVYNMIRRMLFDYSPRLLKLLNMISSRKNHTNFFINSIRETMEFRVREKIIRHDLVDLLMDIKKNQNDIDFEVTEGLLTSQAFVFFLAGFETSSTTISFALYELATSPKVQEKLRSEIRETLKLNNGQLSYDVINEMKYLNMVIQETLRKNPPVSVLRRKSVQPYKLPGTDITLPTGTAIQIPVYTLHHDEQYYSKPEVFDPERFNKNEAKTSLSGIYLPFGDGPKNCIGARFASYQSKLGLVTILKNFRVSPSESTTVPYKIDKTAIILSATGGMNLKFEPLI